jgi:FkbM family methyltransferase
MIRGAARFITGRLPAGVRARIAEYRFGYGQRAGALDVVQRERGEGLCEYQLDGDVRFDVTPEAQSAAKFHFVENGDSREEMAGFLRVSREAPASALLIDVGAHCGLFSIVHLAAGRRHRAILLEPSAPLASTATTLLDANGMRGRADVRVAGVGASNTVRSVTIDALSFAHVVPDAAVGARVPFVTLDALCAETGATPSIVKIDVEGAEAEVIAGARAMLRRRRPVICLELHLDVLERSGVSASRLLDELSAIGYRFESASGRPLHVWRLKRSLKAIERVIAR